MSLPAEQFSPDAFPSPAGSREAFLKQYVPQEDDSSVIARFHRVMEFKPFKSEQTKTHVEEPVDYINIVVRGNDKMEVDRPATDADRRRFPRLWADYQAGRERENKGTPLDQLPGGMTTREIAHFHSLNVFTIEDLAQVTDQYIGALGTGSRERRKRAQEIVNGRTQSGEMERQLAELRDQNARLTTQLSASLDSNSKLAERLDRLEAAQQKSGKKGSE